MFMKRLSISWLLNPWTLPQWPQNYLRICLALKSRNPRLLHSQIVYLVRPFPCPCITLALEILYLKTTQLLYGCGIAKSINYLYDMLALFCIIIHFCWIIKILLVPCPCLVYTFCLGVLLRFLKK